MTRVLVLVEGQTEETFVRDILRLHLIPFGVHVRSVLATTKRAKSGEKFKGGIVSYQKTRTDLVQLLRDRDVAAVTTMSDYYGLPSSFPGVASLPRQAQPEQRARHLENALAADLRDERFVPYLSLHEFEALLFVSPEAVQASFSRTRVLQKLYAACSPPRSPEELNDGPTTHPSARLQTLLPDYRKTLHGPAIVARIGLRHLRERCPHFHQWVSRLENLGSA